MNLVPYMILIIICAILFQSLLTYVRFKVHQIELNKIKRNISIEVFYTLIVIYLTGIIGFGLIYFILSFETTIILDLALTRQLSIFEKLYRSLYFSGVTMLTIGYGDITPVGFGRFIAVVQALIGYILPTAFVLKLVQSNTVSRKRHREFDE